MPDNPRAYPHRPVLGVNADVARAAQQHRELEASMAATGQVGALLVAPLHALTLTNGAACTTTRWSQGPVSVLPRADVVELVELPVGYDDAPRATRVRWDVVARICGPACWQAVADLDRCA